RRGSGGGVGGVAVVEASAGLSSARAKQPKKQSRIKPLSATRRMTHIVFSLSAEDGQSVCLKTPASLFANAIPISNVRGIRPCRPGIAERMDHDWSDDHQNDCSTVYRVERRR